MRRMPITAIALPLTPGSRTSRAVCAGTGAASESAIFCRMSCLYSLSTGDTFKVICLSWKEKPILEMVGAEGFEPPTYSV